MREFVPGIGMFKNFYMKYLLHLYQICALADSSLRKDADELHKEIQRIGEGGLYRQSKLIGCTSLIKRREDSVAVRRKESFILKMSHSFNALFPGFKKYYEGPIIAGLCLAFYVIFSPFMGSTMSLLFFLWAYHCGMMVDYLLEHYEHRDL